MPLDRHAGDLSALLNASLNTPGAIDPAVRMGTFKGTVRDEPYAGYIAKVRESSYRVIDRDFETMSSAGMSEDAILELTLAAALGAANRQLQAGLRAMGTAS